MPDAPAGFTSVPRCCWSRPATRSLARAEDPLAEIGLSGRQYMVLAVLSGDTPPSQQELAGLCGLLPAQVVPVIDELERRGLVARQRSEADRRRSVVSLTPEGAEILAKADELAQSIEGTLFGELDAGAREHSLHGTLRAALRRTAPDVSSPTRPPRVPELAAPTSTDAAERVDVARRRARRAARPPCGGSRPARRRARRGPLAVSVRRFARRSVGWGSRVRKPRASISSTTLIAACLVTPRRSASAVSAERRVGQRAHHEAERRAHVLDARVLAPRR